MPVSDAVVEGVSGAIGGMVALTATYPLMTISTLQAVQGKQVTRVAQDNAAQTETATGKVQGAKSAVGHLLEIIEHSGWTGLFRGLEPALLGTAVSQGIYFYFYSSLRQLAVAAQQKTTASVPGRKADIGVGASLLIAALAGCGNVLVTNPIWVVATRMQAHQKVDSGGKRTHPVAVVRELYADYGWRGFWKGVVPSLVMVTNPTVQYVIYEWLLTRRSKLLVTRKARVTKPAAWEIFYLSATAKLGATILTYPLQLVKTRIQTSRKTSAGGHQYNNGTLQAISQIFKDEGFFGFYNGMKAKMVQSVLAAALLLLIKEELTDATGKLLRGPVKAVQ